MATVILILALVTALRLQRELYLYRMAVSYENIEMTETPNLQINQSTLAWSGQNYPYSTQTIFHVTVNQTTVPVIVLPIKRNNLTTTATERKILAAAKLRYQKNRDTLLAYSKQYQRERKDQVKDRNSAYYEKHRDRLLKDRAIKIECACGKSITKGSLASHLKTKYHLKRVEQDETVNIQTQSTAERTAEAVLV